MIGKDKERSMALTGAAERVTWQVRVKRLENSVSWGQGGEQELRAQRVGKSLGN